MDSKANVGNIHPQDCFKINENTHDELNFPPKNDQSKSGLCHSLGKVIKAVYDAPMCTKVMAALGLLSLVGSGITAYNAYSAMKSTCGSYKPNNPMTPATADTSNEGFRALAKDLPVVIITAQKTRVEARGDKPQVGNKCIVNGKIIGSSSSEKCRTTYTGQKFIGDCRQRKFDLGIDVTPKGRHCELSKMGIKGVYEKEFTLHETCNIYDASGINTSDNIGVQCINLPKTAEEARKALYDLGFEIGNRVKHSPNYEKYNATEGALAYEKIQEMANAYDDIAKDYLLGAELKSGFLNGIRNPEDVWVHNPTIATEQTTKTTDAPCPKPDAAWHASNANMACGFGALGFVLVFGSCLTADFKKAKMDVKVGVPKNSDDMLVMVYNNVSHQYNVNEITFSNGFNYDFTYLVKKLMDSGEDVGDVYEFALEVCDRVDALCGSTTNGDKFMNSIRAYMRESHGRDFTKYLVSVGIEEPENKNGGCWFNSIFSWGSTPTHATHTPVPQVPRAVPEITDELGEPVYAGIPLQFIKKSREEPEEEQPVGSSTPHTQIRAQIVDEENRYSMGTLEELDMEIGDLEKGFSQSLGSLTDGTYREHS